VPVVDRRNQGSRGSRCSFVVHERPTCRLWARVGPEYRVCRYVAVLRPEWTSQTSEEHGYMSVWIDCLPPGAPTDSRRIFAVQSCGLKLRRPETPEAQALRQARKRPVCECQESHPALDRCPAFTTLPGPAENLARGMSLVLRRLTLFDENERTRGRNAAICDLQRLGSLAST
jgi:hypothetical protein